MIAQILSLASPILDKFVPDADTKMKLAAELETQLISLQAAQAATNLEQGRLGIQRVAGVGGTH